MHGDYIVSARYTSTIYKISGQDGSILWRLGGKKSSFTLENFNFSSQHDARAINSSDKVTILTLFNNAESEIGASATTSSAMMVALFTEPGAMIARLVRSWDRPDGGQSFARGNFQLLENGNAFVCWSNQAYISEHSSNGDCLLEARVDIPEVATYRAYKFNYTAQPSESPALRTLLYSSGAHVTAIHHASWNGATEVKLWRFFGSMAEDSVSQHELGSRPKDGFETLFMSSTDVRFVQTVALDSDGKVLGISPVIPVEIVLAEGRSDMFEAHWIFITLLSATVTLVGLWILASIVARSRSQQYRLIIGAKEASVLTGRDA